MNRVEGAARGDGTNNPSAPRSGTPRTDQSPRPRRVFGDTLAWLYAAFQIMGPILLLLTATIALAYGVIHLLFLR